MGVIPRVKGLYSINKPVKLGNSTSYGGLGLGYPFRSTQMADESDPELLRLACIWRKRFGEPPPIVTDAEMIRRVLDSLPPDPVTEDA